jgi:hypothetical protein
MTLADAAAFREALAAARSFHSEGGAGGSTLAATGTGAPRLAPVESDPGSAMQARRDARLPPANARGLAIVTPDVGPAERPGHAALERHRTRAAQTPARSRTAQHGPDRRWLPAPPPGAPLTLIHVNPA